MEKIKCELEKHEHQLSCLLPSVRSPQLGGMWALIVLEYMNSDVFVLSNKTLGIFFNQNYCKLYQTKIETKPFFQERAYFPENNTFCKEDVLPA